MLYKSGHNSASYVQYEKHEVILAILQPEKVSRDTICHL